ncbi:hypothetical protein HPP92_005564 [Vanilla planifolia]|uniref:Uncharacterized protein n=1 Tax=Vanilla planifolia TaxID=51239 RepID=A0A835RNT4_VANPL|nr:hypothetical protein HPP92_005564 [Vanilla planifolia]
MSRVGDALTMSSLRNNFEDNRRRNCCTAVDGGDCAEVSEEFLLAASSFHSITVSESYSSSLERSDRSSPRQVVPQRCS